MTSLVTRQGARAATVAAALLATPAQGQESSVVIRLLAPENSDRTGPVLATAADAFEAAHPGVVVEVELEPWNGLFQALTLALSEDAPPDLAILATSWLPDLIANGDLQPLDDRISAEFGEAFVPGILSAARIDGRTWALPVAASDRALYVNMDLLGDAGVTAPPATWEALEAAALAVAGTADDVHGFGIQGDAIETDVYFYHALWAYGGALIEADGSSGLDTPEAAAAAELYARLIAAGATQPDMTATSREDLQDQFAAGRLGMVISSPYLATHLAAEAAAFDWTVVPVPAVAMRATYGVTDSLVMFADSPVQNEAWLLAEHLMQPEWHGALVAAGGYLPVTRAVAESASIAGDPVASVFAAALPDARYQPLIPNWDEIADLTANALRRIYAGDAEPAEALAAVADEVDALIGLSRNSE